MTISARAVSPAKPLPLARAAAVTVFAIGSLVLWGWAVDSPTLKSVVPGLATMKANTALAFVLAGLALWFSEASRASPAARRLGAGVAVAYGGIGLITIVEYLFDRNLGIDQLLAHDSASFASSAPGRMGVNTALNFVLLSIPLIGPGRSGFRQRLVSDWCTAAAVVIALIAVIGYAYSATSLTGLTSYGQMSLPTAAGLLVLSVGLLARNRDGPLVRIVLSDGPGGVIIRKLLPIMVGLTVLFGWVQVQGQMAGWYGPQFGTSIAVLASIVLLTIIALWGAATLDRTTTERQAQATALEEHAEILELAHVLIRDWDGVIRLWNTGAERFYGWPKAEAVGRVSHELLRTEFPEPLEAITRKLLDLGHWEGELRQRRRDGTLVVVASHWVLRREGDQPVGVLEVNNDVTDRKRAEVRFRAVVESAPGGLIMIDPSGKIVLVNRETERLFGYTRDQLAGQTIEMLVPERFRGPHPGYRADFFAHPQTRAMGAGRDLFGVRQDGKEIPVEIGLNPISTDEGVFVLASVVDITERKKSEQELRRSNEELEQFAYVASHDLQEPLRMVASYTQLLAKRYQGQLGADADEFIGHAVDGVARMRQLITDLLSFSQVGTRGKPFAPTNCDSVLATVLSDFKPTLERIGGVVTHDPLPTILGDESQVAQLFQNLLGNAIKFRDTAPPRIHVSAERNGDVWTFAVRDNGIGVPPEHAARIFAMFQRLHTSAEYPGTGIGLAICKKIVELHGGRIWIESNSGPGSTFRFTLSRS